MGMFTDVCKAEQTSKAINEIAADKLTDMEQTALSRLLNSLLDAEGKEDERTAALVYQGAVDFLWMAFRITLEEKHQLLDLGG